jgi:hypothetical protein
MDIFPSTTHLILVYIHLMYIVDRRLTYIWRVVFYLYYIQKEPISRLQALSVSSETTLVNNSRHYKTQSVVLTCPVKPKGAHVIFSSALTHLKNGLFLYKTFSLSRPPPLQFKDPSRWLMDLRQPVINRHSSESALSSTLIFFMLRTKSV